LTADHANLLPRDWFRRQNGDLPINLPINEVAAGDPGALLPADCDDNRSAVSVTVKMPESDNPACCGRLVATETGDAAVIREARQS